eukprot:m.115809 g.115809  ORF g.115809 m.115809 type:complete len:341 (+) comp9486_c0_seq7:67-1089(+)
MASAAVLADTERVVAAAADVRVSESGVAAAADRLAAQFADTPYTTAAWQAHEMHPKEKTRSVADWIFVVDTLNFSFWHDDDAKPFTVEYAGKQYTGYWSLCAAINRALEEGIPITTPSFYASINDDTLAHIFRSATGTPAPMLAQRRANLHEAGRFLLEKHGGAFANCIDAAGGCAQKLIQMVLDGCTSYRDVAEYNGESVSIYKRVQILVADIWACFNKEGLGRFDDIDTLTMFADYRVPQCLVHLGLLEYSDELTEFLHTRQEMQPGDRREVEIRAASIWSVELLRRALERHEAMPSLRARGFHLNSIVLDFYVWDLAKSRAADMSAIPIHRVRTKFY